MGYDPAETLVRLGRRAEEAGEIELAIKAAVALMSFRWPKLKESSVDLGLGLSNGLAGQLEAARARIEISVCSGIDRPPDDAGAIDATPVPPAPRVSTLSGLRNTVEPYLRLETCLFRRT
jgi:hypothetical protein